MSSILYVSVNSAFCVSTIFRFGIRFGLSPGSPTRTGTMDVRPRVSGLTATLTFILTIGLVVGWPSRRHDLLDDEDIKIVHHRSYVSLLPTRMFAG